MYGDGDTALDTGFNSFSETWGIGEPSLHFWVGATLLELAAAAATAAAGFDCEFASNFLIKSRTHLGCGVGDLPVRLGVDSVMPLGVHAIAVRGDLYPCLGDCRGDCRGDFAFAGSIAPGGLGARNALTFPALAVDKLKLETCGRSVACAAAAALAGVAIFFTGDVGSSVLAEAQFSLLLFLSSSF